jgi:hypothetical protein
MERLYNLNKREEETVKIVDKTLNSYEIMLRRFYETLMNLVDHQKQLGRGVQELLDAAYPPDYEDKSNARDEETATQYNNDDNYMEKLGTGPVPSLFLSTQSSKPSFDSVPLSSAAIPTPSVKVTAGPSASMGPPSTGPPSTGSPSTGPLSIRLLRHLDLWNPHLWA